MRDVRQKRTAIKAKRLVISTYGSKTLHSGGFFNTIVGERGVKASAGYCQRLALGCAGTKNVPQLN